MEKEKFERVIKINERLKVLDDLLDEISPCENFRLSYANKNNKDVLGYKREYISDLFDKYDKMIRAEIQKEIDSLYKEIETL